MKKLCRRIDVMEMSELHEHSGVLVPAVASDLALDEIAVAFGNGQYVTRFRSASKQNVVSGASVAF